MGLRDCFVRNLLTNSYFIGFLHFRPNSSSILQSEYYAPKRSGKCLYLYEGVYNITYIRPLRASKFKIHRRVDLPGFSKYSQSPNFLGLSCK